MPTQTSQKFRSTKTKNKSRKTRKIRKISNKRKDLLKHTIIQRGGKVIDKKVTFKLVDGKTPLSLNFKFGKLNYVLVKLELLDPIPSTHPKKLEKKFLGWHLFYYDYDRKYYDDFIINEQQMNINEGTLRGSPTFSSVMVGLSFKKVEYVDDVIKYFKKPAQKGAFPVKQGVQKASDVYVPKSAQPAMKSLLQKYGSQRWTPGLNIALQPARQEMAIVANDLKRLQAQLPYKTTDSITKEKVYSISYHLKNITDSNMLGCLRFDKGNDYGKLFFNYLFR